MQVITTKGVGFPNGNPQVMGTRSYGGVRMKTTHANHIQTAQKPQDPERVTEGFAAMLNQALGKVETMDVRAQKLTTRAIYDPDSVDVHTLLIASEKARFSLTLTKTLTDGFIRAYRELTSPR